MATVLDIGQQALSLIGVYAPGETVSAEDAATVLSEFQDFIDEMNTEGLNIYTRDIKTFSLVGGVQTRTVGPTGQWVMDRPQVIEEMNLFISSGVRRPMRLLPDEQWANIRFQNVQGPPLYCYNDGSFPNSTFYFYPIPNAAYSLEFYTWDLLTQPADLTTQIAYPPGYKNLFKYNLAERLAMVFDRPLNPAVQRAAMLAMGKVKAKNSQPPMIAGNAGFAVDGIGWYDYRVGAFGNS